MATAEKTQYEGLAKQYGSYEDLPHARIEQQLIIAALGDCTGLTVLDMGGGSGVHARKALDAGAAHVDVVDVSPDMLQAGRDIETQHGRQDKIRWHVGDATKPFHDLPLEKGGYDVVMANWVFDHATTPEELESMWRNVSTHCKPRGKLINTRVTNYEAPSVRSGKYGCRISDLSEIPGGVRYVVNYSTQPPFSHEGTSMKESSSLSKQLFERHGFEQVHVLPPEETEVVRSDPGFFEEFVSDPNCVVLTAKKKA